jgi:hypothetical protein
MEKPFYGTHPWKIAEGTTSEGVRLRFTQTDSAVYATMPGKPKTDSITLKSLAPKAGTLIYLLGEAKPLVTTGRRHQNHASSDSSEKICLCVEDRGAVVYGPERLGDLRDAAEVVFISSPL